jgi:hypothetical protein
MQRAYWLASPCWPGKNLEASLDGKLSSWSVKSQLVLFRAPKPSRNSQDFTLL